MFVSKDTAVVGFWEMCRHRLAIAETHYHATSISDPAIATATNEFLDLSDHTSLIRSGKKRGTAHLAIDFTLNKVPRRRPGDLWIVLDQLLMPISLVKVSTVKTLPFNAVDSSWAEVEGEGNESLAFWREAHRQYYVEQCKLWNREWKEDSPVVLEAWDLLMNPV